MRLALSASVVLAFSLPSIASAQDVPGTPGGQEALQILREAIDIPTVAGRGKVPELAAKLSQRLIAGGFKPDDVRFVPMDDTGYLVATYAGRDRKAKPVVINVHMDVVEAKREDWQRDPFVSVVENGYVFGRGSLDNKADLAMIMAAILKLKRSGWVPSRDLVLGFTGDEETLMATTAALAKELQHADVVLNGDGGGGELDSAGKPFVYSLQAGEKTYGDFRLTATDPGGHSSRPGKYNPISAVGAALVKVSNHRFPAQLSPLTKAYWEGTAPSAPAEVADAMRAFAANPADTAAADLLSSRTEYVGIVRTTCVPTMVNGGHAPNALPQSVTANVNCRIFPGTSRAQTLEELRRIIGDDSIKLEIIEDGSLEAPESPLRPDVMAAVKKAVHERAPGLAIVPSMSAGATDSAHFRIYGIPSFGVAASFLRPEDEFAHGLDERLPVATLDPGVKQWETLLRTLLK